MGGILQVIAGTVSSTEEPAVSERKRCPGVDVDTRRLMTERNMSDETQKALPSTPPILSVDPPPENDLRWHRMVRARNCLIGFWIGGIVTEVVAFPLISVPAMKDYFLPAMGVLTVTWLGGGCVAMLVQSRLEKHMQQRFQSKDAANLGCCIDILFAPAAVAVHGVSASKFYAEARTAVLEQLPGLTEETVLLVRDSERRVLYSTLKGKDAELIPVVLRAIPIFCDARSLPFIRHLAVGWMLTVQGCATESCGKLSDLFRDEHSDTRRSLTSADIGPLLDITVAICGNSLEVPTAMLGDALKAVRAEDEVNLTENQRNFLHELVTPKFLHFKLRDGPPMLEKDRGKVRPAVIAALALLGNRTSIPVLERFARKTKDSVLRQSALQSVEQIRERLKYGPDQMLRASRAPQNPGTLLRAAGEQDAATRWTATAACGPCGCRSPEHARKSAGRGASTRPQRSRGEDRGQMMPDAPHGRHIVWVETLACRPQKETP